MKILHADHPRQRPHSAPKRLASRAALTAVLVTTSFVVAACAPPAPEPTPTPTVAPVQYPAQPAFSESAADVPPADVRTLTSTTASLTSSLGKEGTVFDTDGLLNVSQGGYASMNNLHWFAAQAAQMSSMGIKEIRIDHVFDDPFYKVVSADKAGTVSYDFSRLDQVILPLIAQDLQPFISLSYMPKALSSTNSAYAPPKSMDAWSALVVAFVAHYRDLGHTGWEYEVWNELDTGHWTGTQDEYNALYVASANAVRSVDRTAKIGGPAASGLDSIGDWSENFITFLGANPTVPIDFFTTHSYRSSGWEAVPQARAWLDAAGLSNLPIYISEWNNDSFMDRGAGGGSDTNSSIDGSSYTARRLYLASQTAADKFFYFSPVEGLNPHLVFNGDLGLVTADGHRKVNGNIFEMYSELDPMMQPATVKGEAAATQDVYGLVTQDTTKDTSNTLLWNNTANDVEMDVTLTELPFEKTNFTSTVSMVSGTRGNTFSDASEYIAASYPSPNENAPAVEVAVLKAASEFEKTITIPAFGVVNLALTPTKAKKTGVLPTSAEPSATNIAASAAGAVATASSSIEKPAEGWSLSALSDGRRHSIEPSAVNIKGWSSALHSSPEATETVRIDLGAATPLDTVVMWPRDSEISDGRGFPAAFTIQGSADGINWTNLYAATGYNDGLPVNGPQTFSFQAGEYQSIRVEATSLTAASTAAAAKTAEFGFQLAELEAYRTGFSNGGFELGSLEGWQNAGTATIQSDVVRGGTKALMLTGKGAEISTLLTGLLPNTTYTFGAHVRPGEGTGNVTIKAAEYGGAVKSAIAEHDQWQSVWVTFTTGEQNTSAELSLSIGSGAGSIWADDLLMTQRSTG